VLSLTTMLLAPISHVASTVGELPQPVRGHCMTSSLVVVQ
jgi:hypothetical protein